MKMRAETCRAPERVEAEFAPPDGLASAGKDLPDYERRGQRHATPPEPVAVPVVKRRRAPFAKRNFNRHRADAINAAGFVLENFPHAADGHQSSRSRRCWRSGRAARRFPPREKRRWPCAAIAPRFAEPAVVRQVHQKIRVAVHRVARQPGENILKTNQR